MRGVPPERVLAGHALDQPLDLDFDLGSADLAGSRLTSPIQLESLPMPTNHGVRLHDEQNGLPIRPDLRQKRPEDPITPSQPGGFRLLQQNRELLAQREILRREFRAVTKDAAEEQHQNARHAHFTASEKVNHGLKTVAEARKPSIRNSFAKNGYRIFGMHR